MDASSLSPFLWNSSKNNYFSYLKSLRESLREKLSLTYNLKEFDVLFIPSVRIGLSILSHTLNKYKCILELDSNNNHYQPITEIFSKMDDSCRYIKKIKIITHVGPYNGILSNWQSSTDNIVVDASHSFATLLHRNLIQNSDVFLAPLHKHASIVIGLSVLVIRHHYFSHPIMNDLYLFEKATASEKPFEEALKLMGEKHWKPYNVSSVDQISFEERNIKFLSISHPGLPFVCFSAKSIDKNQKNLINKLGGTYFEDAQIFRLSYMTRGYETELVNHTQEVICNLKCLTNVKEKVK